MTLTQDASKGGVPEQRLLKKTLVNGGGYHIYIYIYVYTKNSGKEDGSYDNGVTLGSGFRVV